MDIKFERIDGTSPKYHLLLVGFAAIVAVREAHGILVGGTDWVSPGSHRAKLGCLAIVMLTWAVGALQYTLEWRFFAGGRWR